MFSLHPKVTKLNCPRAGVQLPSETPCFKRFWMNKWPITECWLTDPASPSEKQPYFSLVFITRKSHNTCTLTFRSAIAFWKPHFSNILAWTNDRLLSLTSKIFTSRGTTAQIQGPMVPLASSTSSWFDLQIFAEYQILAEFITQRSMLLSSRPFHPSWISTVLSVGAFLSCPPNPSHFMLNLSFLVSLPPFLIFGFVRSWKLCTAFIRFHIMAQDSRSFEKKYHIYRNQ